MILSAQRCSRLHRPSRSQKPGIVLGLRYERRFGKALEAAVSGTGFKIERNPWFSYIDDETGIGAASPDILIHAPDDLTYVIEIKYTWVAEAHIKLKNLYCPIVSLALGRTTTPIVVAKRLTPETPKPTMSLLKSANGNPYKVFQWLETAPLSLST